ncbi:MAG TPA: alpha/beta fold hydrolase [Ktedonobacteraceae bacterium]|nr:alpha/beta fold hydrolase [Ktedonobacteraceae bacterium]
MMEHVNMTGDSGNAQHTFHKEIEISLYAKDGMRVFMHAWAPENPRRALVCVQGLGGHGGYYRELACQVAPDGTLVVAPDLRGHGRSEGVRGDIDRFDRYVLDVDVAVAWTCTLWPDIPIFVLGESMGVSIAIQFIARGQNRTGKLRLAGLVFVSPVFSSAIRSPFGEVVHFIRSLLIAPSHPSIAITGREELGCRDPNFNMQLRADPLFVRRVSPRFLIVLTRWFRQSKRQARQVDLPLLVLLGGRDHVARRSATSVLLRNVHAGEQRIVTFPLAYHSLFHDPDTPDVVEVLNAWLTANDGKELSNKNCP